MDTKENAKGTVRTILDELPYGDAKGPDSVGRVKKVKLPEGVTGGRLGKDVIMIAWPSFVELVLSQLTSMADQIMVGRMPGRAGIMALSAVGLAAQPKFLLMTMILAMNVGATALVARYRGRQDKEMANQVFRQALLLNLVISTLFMVLGLAGSEWLIRLMGGSGIAEDTLQQSVTYFNIQMYGFLPACLAFTVTAALRGIGDTKTPMIYNTVSNVVNLILNYVMIYGHFGCPAMGVAGASLATVIGQTVAFLIAMAVVLGKKHFIYLDFREKFRFDGKIMKDLGQIGLPSMIEQLFMRGGVILFTRMVAGLGDTLYATHQVILNIQAMSFMIGQAFGNATTTLMGQCLGKLRYDMAMAYIRTTRKIGYVVSCGLMLVLMLFGGTIVSFYNTDPDVIRIGGRILMLLAIVQPLQTEQFLLSGGLRGAGDTRYTAMVIFVTTLCLRPLLGYLCIYVLNLSLEGAWIAMGTDQLLRSVLMILRYHSGKWKGMKLSTMSGEAAR